MDILKNNLIGRVLVFVHTHYGNYSGTILLIALLTFISSLTEAIGINAIIPLFSFLNGADGDASDPISRATQFVFAHLHIPYTFRNLFLMIAVLFLVKTVVLFVSQFIAISTQVSYERKVRNDLMTSTLNSNWEYISKQKIGFLEQMLTRNVEKSSSFLVRISNLLLILANLIVYSFLSINISPLITFLTLIFGVVIFVGFRPFFMRNRAASEENLKEYRSLAHYINEMILGLKVIKASSIEPQIKKRASDNFQKLRDLSMRIGLLSATSTAILQPLPLFFIMGIFAFFYKTGGFSFASFAVIVYSINRVFNNFQGLQNEIHTLISFMPYVTGISSYLAETAGNRELNDGSKKFSFKKTLEFNNVSFGYSGDAPVVSDISFKLNSGELIGLIGPSGAGKTTLVDLFLRLLEPQKGSIELDGVPISQIQMKEWRENVGYVSQDIFLFNDTIANNIRFYNAELTDADIAEATKLANIYDYIMQLPNGFDTYIGERGLQLSGGQRQRIALARVLARHPQILILDEATSALDNESEIAVHAAIESLKRKITVIVIAHRLDTVMNSDRLIALEKGSIIEEGTPEKLLKDDDSYFSRVYNLRK